MPLLYRLFALFLVLGAQRKIAVLAEKSNSLFPVRQVGNNTQDTYCKRVVPGLLRMAQGIDIATLDLFPADPSFPLGFLRPLFEYTCNVDRVWYDPDKPSSEYQIPDQVESVVPVPSGFLNIKSRHSEKMDQFKNSLAAKVGLEMNAGLFGSFSASVGYKDTQEKMLKSEKTISETSSSESAFQIYYGDEQLPVTTTFQETLDELPARYSENPAAYDAMVASFGTHYFDMAKFGGFLYSRTEVDKKYADSASAKELELNLGASFKLFVQMEAKAELEQISEESRKQFEESSNMRFSYYGGEGLTTFDQNNHYMPQWIQTVSDNPWLFAGQLRPIQALIQDQNKAKSYQIAVMAKLSRAYLGDARDSYRLSGTKLSPAAEAKLKEIEDKLANPSTDVAGLEQLQRELAKLFEELQKIIDDKGGNSNAPLDAGEQFYELIKAHKYDRRCKCRGHNEGITMDECLKMPDAPVLLCDNGRVNFQYQASPERYQITINSRS